MKITITLTKAEEMGIRAYLAQFMDSIEPGVKGIENEIKERLYAALRDPRESISDYIKEAEEQRLKDYYK